MWLLGRREGTIRESGMDTYTLLYLKCITNKGLRCSTGKSAHLRGSLVEKAVWGRMGTCICMAEALCCSPETIPTVFLGYTLIQSKKIFFFNFIFKWLYMSLTERPIFTFFYFLIIRLPKSVIKWKSLSRVQLFVTPWTTQFMEFSRPEYWSG